MKSCKTSANCRSRWVGMVLLCVKGRAFANTPFAHQVGIMDQTQAIWIKDPLSILADGAERGIVVRAGKIVELVPRGREPVTADTAVYDADAHVVLPGSGSGRNGGGY